MIGLVASGPIKKSFLARTRGLKDQLGPLKSSSYRVASRMANTIRAGHPVEQYEDLEICDLILISVPDDQLTEVVSGMAHAMVSWKGKAIVLCDTAIDSGELKPLVSLGAMAASLEAVDGFDEHRFVVEGDHDAVRKAKRLVEATGVKVFELKAGRKPLFLAAVTMSTSLLTPLMAASVEALRLAGLKLSSANSLVDRIVQKSLRGFLKAGRKSWSGPLAGGNAGSARTQSEALRKINLPLARFCESNTASATKYMSGHKARK